MPPSPLGGFPATIDDVALARAVHAAVAASGGCTVTASVSAARLSITYAPRPTLAEGFVDEAWGSGTLTAGALHARFVAHWLAAVEGSVWVDDGTSAGGKAWVQVPASMLGLRDVEAVRAHPLLSLVTLLRQVAPDVAGMGASLTMSHHAQLVGTETIDGAATGHYTWTTARGRREDVWLGHDWLPRRHLAPYDGATPATITIGYRGWGSPQPAVQAPPQDQVTVAPTSRP